MFFQENAAGFFLLQLLFELTAALLCFPKLLLEQITGCAGLPDLSLGPRLMIADPAGGIFFDPFALFGNLFLGRPGFLQLPAHQDRALFFLRETVLNARQILRVLLFRLLQGRCQFALSAGGSFLCLAQIGAELFLAGTPHFHGLVDPALHGLLGRFAVEIEQIQTHSAVFVPDAPDHQLHADRLIIRLVRSPDAEDSAGDGLCSCRLVRVQDQRGHQAVAGDARDLQSIEGVRQDILHVDTVGDTEHGWNILTGKKDSRPGFCNPRIAVRLSRGSLRLGRIPFAAIDPDVPVILRSDHCSGLTGRHRNGFAHILRRVLRFFQDRLGIRLYDPLRHDLRRIFDSAERFRYLAQDLSCRIQPALQPVGRHLEAGRLLKDTIINGAAVRLIGRRPLHSVIKTVAVPAVKPEICCDAAPVFAGLRNFLMNPVAVFLRGHEKGILRHCAREFILFVAEPAGKILIIKNRLLPASVQTCQNHDPAGKICDKGAKLLRTVALGFFGEM